MTFGQQIVSTFIGAIAGFLLSITLFYLTEKWNNRRINKEVFGNLQKELDYNIQFVETYKDDFDQILRKIAINDKQIYTIFRGGRLQRIFIGEAFGRGILYKRLAPEEINNLDTMLNYFTINIDQILYIFLDEYKNDKVDSQISLQRFEFNKSEIEKYLKLLKELKKKLNISK